MDVQSRPAMMRRVVVGTDAIEMVEVPTPDPAPDEVLIRSVVVGICGSDTHAAHGRHPFVSPPYHPGHEVVGVVAAVGAGVTSVAAGQRVAVEPDLPCWHCKSCDSGRENLCENLQFLGCGHEQGAMADYFVVDARRLHVIPDDMDYRTAALIEPLATPVHAVGLAGDLTGRAVAILGAGTIGLLVLRVARAAGARRIVVTARSQASRDRATAHGADAVVDASAPDAVERVRAELGESADVVFDCVAEEPTVRQAVALAQKGGTVVVVGVPPGDVTVPLHLIQDSQVRLQGSATYLPADYRTAIGMLSRGVVRADDFVTGVRPLTEAAEAFADSASGRHTKVLVAPDPSALD